MECVIEFRAKPHLEDWGCDCLYITKDIDNKKITVSEDPNRAYIFPTRTKAKAMRLLITKGQRKHTKIIDIEEHRSRCIVWELTNEGSN